MLLFLKVIAFVIGGWVLIHLLAILGVFLALSYPIWWAVSPKTTVCLFCRGRKSGEICPLCKRKIEHGARYPKTLTSVIINGFLILFITGASLGVIFVEEKAFSKTGISFSKKTVSFVIPSKGQYRLGEVFPMKIEITGIEKPINVVQADLSFDPTYLEAVKVCTNESFANVFIQDEVNNEGGYVRLTGGIPNPGFRDNYGIFGTVYFKGKTAGLATVEFLPTSLVLANDGKGTNIIKDLASSSYLILPEKLGKEETNNQQSVLGTVFEECAKEVVDKTTLNLNGQESVLGTWTSREISENKEGQVLGESTQHQPESLLVKIIGQIDQTILNFWPKTFENLVQQISFQR